MYKGNVEQEKTEENLETECRGLTLDKILRKSSSKGNWSYIQRIERELGENQAKKETKESEWMGGES